jgi:uncharacterized membrane protein YfcA
MIEISNLIDHIWTFNLLLAAFVAIPSGLIQGYAGFGGALVAIPFFAVLFGPITGFAIVLFIVAFGQGTLFFSASKKADWKEVGPVSAASAITISCGILFLVSADPIVLRKGMAVFILLITAFMMSGWNYSGKHNLFSGVITGAVSGVITGSFGVPGFPLQVMYFHTSNSSLDIKRANVLTAMACGAIVAICGLIIQGAYTKILFSQALIIAPIFIIGAKLGEYFYKVAPAEWFKKITYGILILTALTLLIF